MKDGSADLLGATDLLISETVEPFADEMRAADQNGDLVIMRNRADVSRAMPSRNESTSSTTSAKLVHGTKRLRTACFVTPMLAPMSDQDAPARVDGVGDIARREPLLEARLDSADGLATARLTARTSCSC